MFTNWLRYILGKNTIYIGKNLGCILLVETKIALLLDCFTLKCDNRDGLLGLYKAQCSGALQPFKTARKSALEGSIIIIENSIIINIGDYILIFLKMY